MQEVHNAPKLLFNILLLTCCYRYFEFLEAGGPTYRRLVLLIPVAHSFGEVLCERFQRYFSVHSWESLSLGNSAVFIHIFQDFHSVSQ